jgi:diguanylate cyclase (GGDEF)-like protein
MIDIDNFKMLNDTYGHLEGDDALKRTANAIESSVRTCDVATRFGGEEFGVVLTNATKEDAERIAERIRTHCEKALAPWGGSVSLGVAKRVTSVNDVAEIVDRADQALYVAKRTGKNKVVLWSEEMARSAGESEAA